MAEVVEVEAGVTDDASINTDTGANNEEAQFGNIQDGDISGLSEQEVKERLQQESRSLLESEQAVSEQHADREGQEINTEGQPEGEGSEPTREPTVAELQATLEAQAKEVANMQKLMARQGTEVGELRKKEQELESLKAETEEGRLNMDSLLEDPDAAVERKLENIDRQNRIQKLEETIQSEKLTTKNRDVISQYAPEFENQRDMIAKTLEADGIPAENVNEFMANIYRQDPAVAIQLSKRAALEAENAQLRARLKDPADVLQKVDQVARRGPSVTARSGQSAPAQRSLSLEDVDHLSDAEVKAELERIRRNK